MLLESQKTLNYVGSNLKIGEEKEEMADFHKTVKILCKDGDELKESKNTGVEFTPRLTIKMKK